MLSGLLPLFRQDTAYQSLLRRMRALHSASAGADVRSGEDWGTPLGLMSAARPALIAALSEDWSGPIVVVSGSPDDARQLAHQIEAWSGGSDRQGYFQAPDAIFYERVPWDRATIRSRISTLAVFATLSPDGSDESGRGRIVVTSAWAAMTKTVSPMALLHATRKLSVGEVLSLYELLEHCVRAGYEPATVVEEPGTFAHRGSIVDIYAPNQEQPLRIDFFGDEIDSLRFFSPATQRSERRVEIAILAPAREALPEWGKIAAQGLSALALEGCDHAAQRTLREHRDRLLAGESFAGVEYYLPYLYPRASTLLDFLPDNALLLIDDLVKAQNAALNLEKQALELREELIISGQLPADFATPYFSWEQIGQQMLSRVSVDLGFGTSEAGLFEERGGFSAVPKYAGRLTRALEDIARRHRDGQRIVLVTRQAERLSDLMREQHLFVAPTDSVDEPPPAGAVTLVDGILAAGLTYGPADLVVLTDAEVFGWSRPRRRRSVRRRAVSPESFFSDLQEGDYVVHVDYGIGRYHGLVRKTIGGLARDYFEIEYAKGDRVYVPVHQADRVSRYLGGDGRQPRIHRLGGTEWSRVRSNAQKAVKDIAVELLELYAAREVATGHAFSPDAPWQHELEASFPYEETGDQLSALQEVKADMERPEPMDRLICGDVGYGKTEVALRVAFKAVMDGKQVAVLVPTTVLAQQHFHTFRRRLRAFPVVVEMLSRFRTPREQDSIVGRLASGQVDIVIGTHRLLSKDVAFKDLGLLIIDEEQRFGVSHKEQLKQLRHEIDVLTLTATPIPRTLYMALGGVRDMSVIDTPPENRLPIRTVVSEYDKGLVRKAILREMDRGGQVYFVHNRVRSIYLVAERLRRLVPEASVVIGHGQMPENELAQVMLGFAQGEHDVLLCTTIIENGLDIASVNTIIIDRADALGLAQLYQLRGRVGRGLDRAYAYLLYRSPLSDVARKRLETIQEATELGSGFRVAMQDMEIRGAGEILGAEQHGHIVAIGFDLYMRLLQQAVQELREAVADPGAAIQRAQYDVTLTATALGYAPHVDLPVSAYLSSDFMPDSQLRLRFYRRLARIESAGQVDDLVGELRDRFGELPDSAQDLLYLLRVRALAAEAGVESVHAGEEQIALTLPLPLTHRAAAELVSRFPDVKVRSNKVWTPLSATWRGNLVLLLQHLSRLSVAPEPVS